MADLRPIPTPLIYRWRRFLQNIVPFLIFLVGLMFTLWLWDRQSQMGNAIGVAEAQFVDVSSGAEGILGAPGHGEWREFQTVKKGEIIGGVRQSQLGTFRAQIETIQKEKEKVLADRDAAKQKFLFDMHLLKMEQQQDDQWFELRRLYWRVEEILQDTKDRKTRIASAQAELRTLAANLQFNENSKRRGGAISDQEVVRSRLRVRELEALLVRERKAIEVAKNAYARNYSQLKQRKGMLSSADQEYAAQMQSVVRTMVKPFQKELEVLGSRTNEIEAAMKSAAIVSPIDGVITQVFKVPGEALRPGDPVVRIASPYTNYIVSYVRHRQRIQPIPNMAVKLRTRHTGSRPVDAKVVQVGPQVQPVPPEHLMDPGRPEWGYPIKIEMPKNLQGLIRPGEPVDIIFPSRVRSSDNSDAGAAAGETQEL